MTRLLCTGDIHIREGSPYADDRLADQHAVLEQIIDVARDREVDGVLLAGDIFERPKPTPAELHTFRRFARRLEQSAIPCVAILGDVRHDQLAADQPTALELFANGDWMRVSRHPEVIHLDGATICTLPAAPVTRLIAAHGGRDDVNDVAVVYLIGAAAELRKLARGVEPAVLLAHWAVEGASLPNGLPVSTLHKPILPLHALEELGFDAIVLGDIHKPQDLSLPPDPPIFYVGSPMCLNFGEAGDHGCWLLELDADSSRRDWIPLSDRRFVTVDVDLEGRPGLVSVDVDETDFVAAAIAEQLPITDSVIRIRYRCTEVQARRVDVQALKGFCLEAGAHRVYQIVPEIVRATRARAVGVDEQLDPVAALHAYCDAQHVEDPDRSQVERLLKGYLAA